MLSVIIFICTLYLGLFRYTFAMRASPRYADSVLLPNHDGYVAQMMHPNSHVLLNHEDWHKRKGIGSHAMSYSAISSTNDAGPSTIPSKKDYEVSRDRPVKQTSSAIYS